MNNFVYHGENRRILVASLIPSIGIAILGPQLGHGMTLGSLAVSGLILSMFLAARAFSVDHQVLLKRLGERQAALADVERKLSLAIDASGDGTFEVDLVSSQSRVSAGWSRMMGYEPGEVTDYLFSFIHPEDAPAVRRTASSSAWTTPRPCGRPRAGDAPLAEPSTLPRVAADMA